MMDRHTSREQLARSHQDKHIRGVHTVARTVMACACDGRQESEDGFVAVNQIDALFSVYQSALERANHERVPGMPKGSSSLATPVSSRYLRTVCLRSERDHYPRAALDTDSSTNHVTPRDHLPYPPSKRRQYHQKVSAIPTGWWSMIHFPMNDFSIIYETLSSRFYETIEYFVRDMDEAHQLLWSKRLIAATLVNSRIKHRLAE